MQAITASRDFQRGWTQSLHTSACRNGGPDRPQPFQTPPTSDSNPSPTLPRAASFFSLSLSYLAWFISMHSPSTSWPYVDISSSLFCFPLPRNPLARERCCRSQRVVLVFLNTCTYLSPALPWSPFFQGALDGSQPFLCPGPRPHTLLISLHSAIPEFKHTPTLPPLPPLVENHKQSAKLVCTLSKVVIWPQAFQSNGLST